MTGRTKIAITERIPASLVDAMNEVVALLRRRDDSTVTESDDLIQIFKDAPHRYVLTGGLYSAAERRFGFSIYEGDFDAGENVDEGGAIEWFIDLSPEEIEKIAGGQIVEREMWRCDPDCGRRWDGGEGYCSRCDRI